MKEKKDTETEEVSQWWCKVFVFMVDIWMEIKVFYLYLLIMFDSNYLIR